VKPNELREIDVLQPPAFAIEPASTPVRGKGDGNPRGKPRAHVRPKWNRISLALPGAG
jgi:hypothetical protein